MYKSLCADCGRPFDALGAWQRVCKMCYAAAKRQETDELRSEVSRLRRELAQLRYQRPPAAAVSPDDRFVRELLMLTHPDRHGGSKLSTEVTQRLLAMRKR